MKRELAKIGLAAAEWSPPLSEAEILLKVRTVQDRSRPKWEALFRSTLRTVLRQFGRKLNGGLVDFGAKIDFEIFNPRAETFLATHLPKLAGEIEETTLAEVSRIVRKAIAEGWSPQDTARGVFELFEMSESRSLNIAQTEIGIAASTADYLAARAAGLDLVKVWSNSQDTKVRDSHLIEREWREMDARFSNGLRYPLDPAGPPAEICRCRCCLLYVPREELAQWAEAA